MGVMYRFIIKGVVQGVGFRPYIYRKAKSLKLSGYVKNTGAGVEIVVNDRDFVKKLKDLPPLAIISGYKVSKLATKKRFSDFKIIKSKKTGGQADLPADIYMCNDCLKELRSKKNRRYGYYFITCTNCGPRFSIINDYPYDRHTTSMSEFEMCKDCEKEYNDKMDRRFHAETIACKKCGPKLFLHDGRINISEKTDRETISKAADIIREGKVLAIKGVGGFHLCAKESASKSIRKILGRPHKPFALMVKDVKTARKLVNISKEEEKILESVQRPIVVLRKKNKNRNKEISELDSLGIMLPYTPLHYLLFDHIDEPLIMTSFNLPGEPMITGQKENTSARYSLFHQRRIVNRVDDSVVKIIGEKTVYLRRSRGFVPLPVILPIRCEDTIALGAEMNNTICITKGNKAYISQYIGDTSKLGAFEFQKKVVSGFVRLARLNPKIIVCDAHPEYNSSKLAMELAKKYNAKLVRVQHHLAHIASVAAEHRLNDYVGIAMDGLGFGKENEIWGGEVFVIKRNRFTRIGHLEEQQQLGGDLATIHPKKMLFGILAKFMPDAKIRRLGLYEEDEIRVYKKQLEADYNAPKTTSAGRVLDAAAALLGLCDKRTYDGRPAMLLESRATIPFELKPVIRKEKGESVLLTTPLFEFLAKNLDKDKGRLAATAQDYIARGVYEIAKAGKKPIVFSGGVAYNRMISSFLKERGVLLNKEIPPGDGGISFGQAYLANTR